MVTTIKLTTPGTVMLRTLCFTDCRVGNVRYQAQGNIGLNVHLTPYDLLHPTSAIVVRSSIDTKILQRRVSKQSPRTRFITNPSRGGTEHNTKLHRRCMTTVLHHIGHHRRKKQTQCKHTQNSQWGHLVLDTCKPFCAKLYARLYRF